MKTLLLLCASLALGQDAKLAKDVGESAAKVEAAKPKPITPERMAEFDRVQIRYLLAENKRLAHATSEEEIPKGMKVGQMIAIYDGLVQRRNEAWAAYLKMRAALQKDFGGDGWEIDPETKEWTQPPKRELQ